MRAIHEAAARRLRRDKVTALSSAARNRYADLLDRLGCSDRVPHPRRRPQPDRGSWRGPIRDIGLLGSAVHRPRRSACSVRMPIPASTTRPPPCSNPWSATMPLSTAQAHRLAGDGCVLRTQRHRPGSPRRRRLRPGHRHRQQHDHLPAGSHNPRELAPTKRGRSGCPMAESGARRWLGDRRRN